MSIRRAVWPLFLSLWILVSPAATAGKVKAQIFEADLEESFTAAAGMSVKFENLLGTIQVTLPNVLLHNPPILPDLPGVQSQQPAKEPVSLEFCQIPKRTGSSQALNSTDQELGAEFDQTVLLLNCTGPTP